MARITPPQNPPRPKLAVARITAKHMIWLAGRLAGRLAGWLAGRLPGLLTGWLAGPCGFARIKWDSRGVNGIRADYIGFARITRAGWLVGLLAGLLAGWLACWLRIGPVLGFGAFRNPRWAHGPSKATPNPKTDFRAGVGFWLWHHFRGPKVTPWALQSVPNPKTYFRAGVGFWPWLHFGPKVSPWALHSTPKPKNIFPDRVSSEDLGIVRPFWGPVWNCWGPTPKLAVARIPYHSKGVAVTTT